MKVPRDLWHVVLFYTTGNTVRRVLEEAGEPGYTPCIDANNLWTGSWGRFREAIEATWPAYLDGESTLSRSTLELMKALGSREDQGR